MENKHNITIIQGASWNETKFYYPGDISAGTAKGQIRTNMLDKSGALLAEFTFLPIVYGQVTVGTNPPVDRSIIFPQLSAAQTAAIAYNPNKLWVYDIFVSIGSQTIDIARGTVTVQPRVTEVR